MLDKLFGNGKKTDEVKAFRIMTDSKLLVYTVKSVAVQ